MPADHPEDLSARLRELEATVRGLTQELVAANERIRQLERTLEEDRTEADGGSAGGATRATRPEDETDTDTATEEATPDGGSGDLDDIIVA